MILLSKHSQEAVEIIRQLGNNEKRQDLFQRLQILLGSINAFAYPLCNEETGTYEGLGVVTLQPDRLPFPIMFHAVLVTCLKPQGHWVIKSRHGDANEYLTEAW